MTFKKNDKIAYVITEDHAIYKVEHSDGKKKYIKVEDHVEKYNILWGELAEESDKVDCFHKKNGAGYEITRCCLEAYLKLAYGRKNPKYDGKTIVDKSRLEDIENYEDALSIFQVIGVMGIAKRTERYFKRYTDSNIYCFIGVLTQLIDVAVLEMEESRSKHERDWAGIIRACWMDIEYEDWDVEELSEHFGYKVRTFYRAKEHAITALSKRLFGDIPGEKGIHNFATDEDGTIIFKGEAIKIRKSKRKAKVKHKGSETPHPGNEFDETADESKAESEAPSLQSYEADIVFLD